MMVGTKDVQGVGDGGWDEERLAHAEHNAGVACPSDGGLAKKVI